MHRMTLTDKVEAMLKINGMNNYAARRVILKLQMEDKSLQKRWNDDILIFSDEAVRWIYAKVLATGLQWLDENDPDNWCKILFEKELRK